MSHKCSVLSTHLTMPAQYMSEKPCLNKHSRTCVAKSIDFCQD